LLRRQGHVVRSLRAHCNHLFLENIAALRPSVPGGGGYGRYGG
jgi:hypothetical protein